MKTRYRFCIAETDDPDNPTKTGRTPDKPLMTSTTPIRATLRGARTLLRDEVLATIYADDPADPADLIRWTTRAFSFCLGDTPLVATDSNGELFAHWIEEV